MGAGRYVGRIGGLAVALGVGAAVFIGPGVAWAEPADGSGSESTSTSESSTDSSSESTQEQTAGAETPDGPADSGEDDSDPADPKAPVETKRSTVSRSSERTTKKVVEPTRTAEVTDTTPTVRTQPTAALDTAEEPPAAEEPAPTPGVTAAPVVRMAPAASAQVEIEPSAVPTATVPQDPVTMVTAAMTQVAAVLNPFADDAPTGPVESPLSWILAASARRELIEQSLAASAMPAPTPVVAIPQTPPLLVFQQLPIIGPLFVTPIVAFIHQIPVISDVLHPFIGFPVQMGLPAGTPVARDVKVISFDGTPIYVHFMPAVGLQAGQRAPTILNGPGLGLPGNTNLDGALFDDVITDAVGQVSVGTLRRAGYNVVTWDPRGEWNSGGVLEVDSPDFEGRDVSAIISYVAAQPEALLDSGVLDPRMGMVGVSYGGGIQLVTAAIDHRVDAIVPTIAWNSLNSSLYKDEAFKSSWGTLLAGALIATGARVNPRIFPAAFTGALTGVVSEADQDLLASRGPDYLLGNITAPTLLIQGTVDTLFTLQEADENAMALMANGVETKVIWFCGGHGLCANNLFDFSDGELIEQRTLEWLDRYVKLDLSVDTGPQFEWVDQRGQRFSSATYPVAQGTPLLASSGTGGVLPLVPVLGGSLPGFVLGTRAANAVNLTIPAAATTTFVVGAPQLTFTYSGTGVGRHVYAQLVDDTTGFVLGSHVTPIPVTLDGQTRTVTIPLEQVAHTLRPGETVTLQIVASAGTYQTFLTAGVLQVSSIGLSLPTADASAISSGSALAIAA